MSAYFLLLAPGGEHRVLTGWNDDTIEKFTYAAPWALAISPNGQSVIYSKIRESPERLYLERKGDESPILEAAIPWNKADGTIPEIHWLREDGSEALILANRNIYAAQLAGTPDVKLILENSRGLAVSNGQLLYIPEESRRQITLCRLEDMRCQDPRIFNFEANVEQVVWAGQEDQALLLTYLPETVHYQNISLLDLRSGKVRPLKFPSTLAWVVGVHPVPGTTAVILEEGGRTELIDGSTQIRFYLWDYETDRLTLFYEDCRGKVLFRHRL